MEEAEKTAYIESIIGPQDFWSVHGSTLAIIPGAIILGFAVAWLIWHWPSKSKRNSKK